jgi:hypothetical protein
VTCDAVDVAALEGCSIRRFIDQRVLATVFDDSSTGATPDITHALVLHRDHRAVLEVKHQETYWGCEVTLDVRITARWTLEALEPTRFRVRLHEPVFEARVGDDAHLRRAVAEQDVTELEDGWIGFVARG